MNAVASGKLISVDYSGINVDSEPEPQPQDARSRLDTAILAAQRGVKVLRIGSIVFAIGTVMGCYGQWTQYGSENFGQPSLSNWMKFSLLFQNMASAIGFSGILLASSYLLGIYAARSELQATTPPPAAAPLPFSLQLPAPASTVPQVIRPPIDPTTWQPGPVAGTDSEATWRPPTA